MSRAHADRACGSIDYDLASGDEEVRRLGVERLSELPDDEALPRLVASMGDASWRVRKAAVARAATLRDGDAVVAALIAALADGENSGRRNAAVEALIECGPRAVPALVGALDSEDVDVRKQLVDVLAGIGDASAGPALRARLADADANVSAAAADALGVIGGDGVGAALAALASEPGADALVRISALRSLGRLGIAIDVDVAERLAGDALLRPAVFEALGASDDPRAADCLLKGLGSHGRTSRAAAVAGLVALLGREDGGALVALAARVREVARSEPSIVEAVAEGLPASDLAQRMTAIQFLAVAGGERAALAILEAARDEALEELAVRSLVELGAEAEAAIEGAWSALDGALRRVACAVLGATPGDTGRRRLVQCVDDADTGTRLAAIGALGASGDVDSVPALLRALDAASEEDDDADDHAGAAVDALARISERRSGAAARIVDGIVTRLDGASEGFRCAAAELLGRLGREEDAAHVAHLARDPSADVRRAAVASLARIAHGTWLESLRLALADESWTVRCAAAAALGAAEREGVLDDLERLALDEDARVRAAAVRAIGEHGARVASVRERARERVTRAFGDDVPVAIAAGEALAAFGDAAAARLATALLDHPVPEAVLAGVACIREHGDANDAAELIALVGHPDWTVRADVVQTLGRRRVARAVPAILRRLEVERDAFVRETILDALRRLEG